MSALTADLFISLDGFRRAVDVGPYFGYGGPELTEWIRTELDDSEVPLLTMGSLSLVRNLTSAGLVDWLRVMVFPLACESWAGAHLRRGKARPHATRADHGPRQARRVARVPHELVTQPVGVREGTRS